MIKYFKPSFSLGELVFNKNGATAIEYGLIAGLIAVAIVAVLTTLGGNLTHLFGNVSSKVAHAADSGQLVPAEPKPAPSPVRALESL